MRNFLIILVLCIFAVQNVLAYSIKVYDEYGNRVGTYKKEGDKYQFYDFNDNKVDRPEVLIEDAPTERTLTEYTQTFYDENMMPIGTWRSGYFGNDGRYYPRGYFYPAAFYKTGTPSIVRPHANGYLNHNSQQHLHQHLQTYPDTNNKSGTYYEDTRFPKFHDFKQY